jgi:hypothetical protein
MSQSPGCERLTSGWRLAGPLFSIMLVVGAGAPVVLAEPPGPADSTQAAGRSADEQARRKAFSIGMLLIAGITFCGLSLIGLVMVWGHRTRRLARMKAKQSPRDELFFLKGRGKHAADSPPPGDRPTREE